jgi:hypothetical protein
MIRILLWKLDWILKIAFSRRDRSVYPILCLSTSVADPAFHFDSYPNLTFPLMRIQIHCEPPQLHCESSGPQMSLRGSIVSLRSSSRLLWCGVAQLVARRLAGRQARVRFSARHHREFCPTELTSDEEMERGLGECIV